MERSTGILDLATHAACRALASWQQLTGTVEATTPPALDADDDGTTVDRHAA